LGKRAPSSSLARSRPEAGAARRRRPAGLPATAAASEGGESERASRGFTSTTHLGLGHGVEADRRGDRGAAAAFRGGGAVGFGEEGRRCGAAALVWCDEPGRPSALFYRRRRRVREWRYFSGEAAGELGELRELRPVMRRLGLVCARRGSAGDGTRRAGVGASCGRPVMARTGEG
jgi:hypothetical protein